MTQPKHHSSNAVKYKIFINYQWPNIAADCALQFTLYCILICLNMAYSSTPPTSTLTFTSVKASRFMKWKVKKSRWSLVVSNISVVLLILPTITSSIITLQLHILQMNIISCEVWACPFWITLNGHALLPVARAYIYWDVSDDTILVLYVMP